MAENPNISFKQAATGGLKFVEARRLGKPLLEEAHRDVRRPKLLRPANFADIQSLQDAEGRADEFLKNAEASIVFSLGRDVHDSRALELINKTNQFNLNGKRFSESDWIGYLNEPGAFLLTANYEDKYGPLGKVSVLIGRDNGSLLTVDGWAMSCRAFSRRIEYQILRYLFDVFRFEEIIFEYRKTDRNGPLQGFFARLLQRPPDSVVRISNRCFSQRAPSLYHRVEDTLRHGA